MFQYQLGGFITHKGTLAGITCDHKFFKKCAKLIRIDFLPVKGNDELFKNLDNSTIKIVDIYLKE